MYYASLTHLHILMIMKDSSLVSTLVYNYLSGSHDIVSFLLRRCSGLQWRYVVVSFIVGARFIYMD